MEQPASVKLHTKMHVFSGATPSETPSWRTKAITSAEGTLLQEATFALVRVKYATAASMLNAFHKPDGPRPDGPRPDLPVR
jgi:hypothetical protein